MHDWKEKGLGHRSIANKMADLRWLASKVGRSDQIPKENKLFGLSKRSNSHESKAIPLDRTLLVKLGTREQLITELRALFGLRTEEACKFQYLYATKQAGVVTLKGNWCKGGRPRTITIINDQQRDLLERVGRFQTEHQDRSMIPNHRTFKSYYRDYNEAREKVGIPGHALRHQWAQDRFKQISGLDSPHAGGKAYSELSKDDQAKWDRAAEIVNSELGHGRGRHDITATYIGKRE